MTQMHIGMNKPNETQDRLTETATLRNQGRASPECDFTVETSEALMAPFAFTSLRKLALDTGAPLWAFVALTSLALTSRIASYVSDENAHVNRGIGKGLEKLIGQTV